MRLLLTFLCLACAGLAVAQENESEIRLRVAQLGSAESAVRDEATERLIDLSPACYRYVKSALTSRDADVRLRARAIMSGLHQRIEVCLREIIAANGRESAIGRERWDWLMALGDSGVTPLLDVCGELLRESSVPDRDPVAILGMMALKELMRPEQQPALFAILEQPGHPMSTSTARLLGDLRFHEAVPVLIKALQNGDNGLQAAAAWALGWIHDDERILPALHEAYGNETDAEVRHTIACAVSRYGDMRYMDDAIAWSKSLVEAANPTNTRDLNRLGCDYLFIEDWDNAIATFERMLALSPENQTAHYNICCAYSLQDKTAEALKSFKAAVGHGYVDVQHLENDTDLDNLRTLPEFQAIVEKLKDGAGSSAVE